MVRDSDRCDNSLAAVIIILATMMSGPARADWLPEVRLTNNPSNVSTLCSGSRSICAAGEVVNVVWKDDRAGNDDIYAVRSTDGGATWLAEQALTNDQEVSQHAAIACDGNLVVVVWEDFRDQNWEIYYKVSRDGGASWSQDSRLTVNDASSANPCVAVWGQTIHVVWQDSRDGGPELVYYARSNDAGVTWTEARRMDMHDTGSWTAAIAVWDTMVHVVWNGFDNSNTYPVVYYVCSFDGGNNWEPVTRIADVNSTQLFPMVAAWGSQVHAVWHDARENTRIYHRRSDDGGRNWGEDRIVSTGEFFMTIPALAVVGQNVHVAFHDARNGSGDVYYQRSTDGGSTWYSEDYRLTPGDEDQAFPCIAAAGSAVHVVWTDAQHLTDLEVYYRRDPSGSGIEDLAGRARGTLVLCPNPFVRAARALGREAERFEAFDLAGNRAGSYSGSSIGADLLPGVYFLRSGDGDVEARIVKTR